MNLNNWKDLYENEKRQRLHIETTMKEIVNGLCLSAFTISEDSKMQLLKNELQRLQQEIVRLEGTKQQRLQQHLMSVGGMIQQMSNSNGHKVPTQNMSSNMSNNANNRTFNMNQQPNFATNNLHSTFDTFQRQNGTTSIDAQRLSASLQNGNMNSQQILDNAKFQKPRAPARAPRRKRNAVTTDEIIRPNTAVPPPNWPTTNANLVSRPMSAIPPPVLKNTENIVKPIPIKAPVSEAIIAEKSDDTNVDVNEQNNNSKSQAEDEIVVTGTVESNILTGTEKSEFFCDFCETTSTNVEETITHLWTHVNEIKRMHAFECVIKDCNFKSNVTKEALTHKKTHSAEDNCKILDRRDSLNEYFKHCVNKYFVRLDEATKEKIYETRHF